jgi:branched-chain amino acid transport system substrate-binding protein
MMRKRYHYAALAAVGTLVIVGCGSDKKSTDTTKPATATTAAAPVDTAGAATTAGTTEETTAETTAETSGDTTESTTADTASETTEVSTESTAAETTEPSAEGWTVDTSNCSDPEAAEAPIEGELTIGSAQPLSGTPAVAFAPVKDGFELYLKYANDNNLLDGITLKSDIKDDQYDATQTPGVVSSLIDDGVNIFSGIIGTPNNLAVRDTLNEECIPQLLNLTGSPDWGNDVASYPWTTGALVPYDIESRIYVNALKDLIPEGGSIGLFTVNSEFGKTYAEAFKSAAEEAGFKIVDEETIEPAEEAPPTNQVGAIAAAKPDAVMAVPLGAQCPTFLKELVNAEAANADWHPVVFQTNTCASRLLISLLAGTAGDGVYTSTNILDPSDPANASNAGVTTFKAAYDAAGLQGDLGTTAVGWSVGEDTVNILKAAQATGTLSRKSIIEAARNLTFTPSLASPTVEYKMNGEEDGFSFQTLQVEQWDQAANLFKLLGDPDSSGES